MGYLIVNSIKNSIRLICISKIRLVVQCLLVLTVFCLFLPLQPVMPTGIALDPSWMIGINQAVSQKMRFGQEMIFTFGPYASIYTRAYHPATEHLELFGSAYLAALYAIALIGALKQSNLITLLGVLLLLAGFTSSNDCLFFSYGLLVGIYVQKIILQDTKNRSGLFLNTAIFVLLFSGFGLYPLIKGTLFAFYFSIATLAFLFCCWRQKWALAAIIPTSIALSTLFFWTFAGQSIQDIPTYFFSISSIIAGYTDAMSITGNTWEIITYAFTSILLLLYLARTGGLNIHNLYLLILFSLFLFINFKAGFVRHDLHSLMCGVAIVYGVLLASNLLPAKKVLVLVMLALATLIQTEISHKQFNLTSIHSQITGTYSKALEGAKLRIFDHEQLDSQFKSGLESVAKIHTLPKLAGTSDIYPFDQMFLIASGNTWQPRPVLQSYSVYNPKLSNINSEFLQSTRSPDNIFFRVQSIDERYPSSDDGQSWLPLINRYIPNGFAGDYLILKKKSGSSGSLVATKTLTSSQSLTSWVDLPKSNDKIFAQIEIEHSLIGKLKNLFFKSSPLGIAVRLQDGTVKQYRLIADIARSQFLLSPLIENAQEFSLLYQDSALLDKNRVNAISVWVEGNPKDWRNTYKLTLESFR